MSANEELLIGKMATAVELGRLIAELVDDLPPHEALIISRTGRGYCVYADFAEIVGAQRKPTLLEAARALKNVLIREAKGRSSVDKKEKKT